MSAVCKIPPLRFKGFEGAWEEKRLGEMGSPYNGLSGKCKSDFGHGNGRYVTYLNVFNNSVVGADGCDRIEVDKSQNEVCDGDVFFTTSSETPEEVGMASVWRGNGDNTYLNSFCFGYRPKSKINANFWAYMLRSDSFRDRIVVLAQGISRYNISKGKVMELPVSLPKDAEQQKIGSTFCSLDALIADRESAVEKLQTLKKAMLEKMFPRAGAKVPEVRFKGCEGEWKEKRLGDTVRFAKGKGYSKSDIQSEGTPLFLYGRMYTDYQTEVDRVDTFCVQRNGSVLSVGNEVVCPASGETAEDIACASAVKGKGIVLGGDLNILVPYADSGLDSTFLAMSLTYGPGRSKIVERAQGKTVVHIHNSDLDDVVVLSPSLHEQRKIGAYFRSLDALISARQEEVGKMKDLKKGLLDRMFV